MKLRQVVPWGFSIIVAITLANSLLSKLVVNGLTTTTNDVMHSYRVQTSLQELQEILVDVQLGERGFIITRNNNFLAPYYAAQKSLGQQLSETKALIGNDLVQLKRLEGIEDSSRKTIDILARNIAQVRKGYQPSSEDLLKGKEDLELVRSQIDAMIEAENQSLATKQKNVREAEQLSTIVSLGGTLLSAVIGICIILFVIRKVVKPINEVTTVITSSSTEIAATVEQQERVATDQASSANQTSRTMEELGASARHSAEQAEMAATGAKQVATLAEAGKKAVGHTLEDMAMLKEKVQVIAEQILQLSEQTGQIGTISGLVSELANQTNMLALNAAVEAVRAGENGKGFAVLAGEIRKLADQSKRSAEKINVLVQDIQAAIDSTVIVTDEGTKTVEQGVKTARGMAETFTGVTDAINTVAVNSQKISLTAKQQAIAIQQVVEAMNMLNQGVIQTASGVSQTKTGVQKLNEAAFNLQEVV